MKKVVNNLDVITIRVDEEELFKRLQINTIS